MKKSFFEFLGDELPTAIRGYYSPNDSKIDVTEFEKKELDKLILPYIAKGSFSMEFDFNKVFFCLFRAIKEVKSKLVSEYERNKKGYEDVFQAEEIKQIRDKFFNRKIIPGMVSLKKAEFRFSDKSRILLTGNITDFFFEMLFMFFDKLEDKNFNEKDISIELSALLYFKRKYEEELDLKKKKGKRSYKKAFSYDEFHELIVKKLCKEIHSFLINHSTITPKESKASTNELNFIKSFIELTGLHKFEELQHIRNWIFR